MVLRRLMVADSEVAGGPDDQHDQLLPITDNLDIPFRNRVWRKYRPPCSSPKHVKLFATNVAIKVAFTKRLANLLALCERILHG
jgi:hypothetical protein